MFRPGSYCALCFCAPGHAASLNETLKITASDATANDFFGRSVTISGTTAIIGAIGNADAGSSSGSAYAYDTTTGNELYKFTASDAGLRDLFGFFVAVSETTVVVGAFTDDDDGSQSGSAYIFNDIPEPGSVSLLDVSGMPLLRRRECVN